MEKVMSKNSDSLREEAVVVKRKPIKGVKKILSIELPIFARQIGAMYKAGIPVVQSLAAIEDQVKDENFKRVVSDVKKHIEEGGTLSSGCALYPEVFDDLFVNMLKAGEQGGVLGESMQRLAIYLESTNKLKRKVKSAMMYPSVVSGVAVLLSGLMLVFIVPVFGEIYSGFDAKLPGPTQVLINISDAIRNHSLAVIGGVVLISVLFSRWRKSSSGELYWDELKLKFPVFGPLMQKVSMSRFASTYAQLSRSGVPILKSLDIVSMATGNKMYEKVLQESKTYVERGETLSKALEDSGKFPSMMLHMLKAGEQTSQIDEMFDNISLLYEDEVENMLAGLTSLIEPFLIVLLGILIGGIVVCMFLPIFGMHELVKM